MLCERLQRLCTFGVSVAEGGNGYTKGEKLYVGSSVFVVTEIIPEEIAAHCTRSPIATSPHHAHTTNLFHCVNPSVIQAR